MQILAFDPGKHLGMAVVIDGDVVSMDRIKLPDITSFRGELFHDAKALMLGSDRVVVERACVRGGASRTAGSALKVAEYAATIYGIGLGLGVDIQIIPVMRWKGNTPKNIIHKKLLSKCEHLLPTGVGDIIREGKKKTVWEDALDAVGLALWGYNNVKKGK